MSSDRQDVARAKAAKLLKRHGSASSLLSGSEFGGRYKPAGYVIEQTCDCKCNLYLHIHIGMNVMGVLCSHAHIEL